MRNVQIPGGLIKENAFLSFGTVPEGAAWFVDNTFMGITNQSESYYWVSPGVHTIKISKTGYADWTGNYSLQWPKMKDLGLIYLKKLN